MGIFNVSLTIFGETKLLTGDNRDQPILVIRKLIEISNRSGQSRQTYTKLEGIFQADQSFGKQARYKRRIEIFFVKNLLEKN